MKTFYPGLGARHRIVVLLPGSILGIVDQLVCLITLGFIQTSPPRRSTPTRSPTVSKPC